LIRRTFITQAGINSNKLISFGKKLGNSIIKYTRGYDQLLTHSLLPYDNSLKDEEKRGDSPDSTVECCRTILGDGND